MRTKLGEFDRNHENGEHWRKSLMMKIKRGDAGAVDRRPESYLCEFICLPPWWLDGMAWVCFCYRDSECEAMVAEFSPGISMVVGCMEMKLISSEPAVQLPRSYGVVWLTKWAGLARKWTRRRKIEQWMISSVKGAEDSACSVFDKMPHKDKMSYKGCVSGDGLTRQVIFLQRLWMMASIRMLWCSVPWLMGMPGRPNWRRDSSYISEREAWCLTYPRWDTLSVD